MTKNRRSDFGKPRINMAGLRFGRLVVLRPSLVPCSWVCLCDCGNEKIINRGNLKNGSTQSCGCYRNTQGGHSHKHPLWKRWEQMINRCTDTTHKDFGNYGGRGITVCRRWRSFPNFLKDMEKGFFKGATLERRNNDGGYDPNNVEWATAREQAWNRRASVIIETPWGDMSRGEAASRFGIETSLLISRARNGWSMERLFDPKNKEKALRFRQPKSPGMKQRISIRSREPCER